MKNKLSFLVLSVIFLNSILIAQLSKPEYTIHAERADTSLGEFTIELFPLIAPLHTAYFDSLVSINFYDSLAFHRVVPEFVVQGGDPNSKNGPRETWGEGDSSQATILAEFSGVSHLRGIIGAARDEDINSANSQFYINVADNPFLDWNYTAFGQVISGMDVVDFIVNVPRDANDNPLEKIIMFVTKGGESNLIPDVPTLISPQNNSVGILSNDTLWWEKVNDAVMYHLEFSKTNTFDSLFLEKEVGYNFYRIEDIELGNIQFFWRVKSNNGGSVSEYSDVRNFYTSIEAPILIYPEMNEDSITINPTFSWQPVNGASGYRLQIAQAPTFLESRIVLDVDTITVNYFESPPLESNRSHYWRVYSLTPEYQGPVSEFRRFVTPDLTSADSEDKLPQKFALFQNYPNPFNPSTTIKYNIASSSVISNPNGVSGEKSLESSNSSPFDRNQEIIVTLKVYDILGREIATLVNQKQNPGNYEVSFEGLNLTSGVYYYQLKAGQFLQTKKMVLSK